MAGLDITPGVPTGRQVIQSYGGGRFRIGGIVHDGSVLVRAQITSGWPVTDVSEIAPDALAALLGGQEIEILVVGCGAGFRAEPSGLRRILRASGIALEWMDTGAACRTFNVLTIEGRSSAAALIAID